MIRTSGSKWLQRFSVTLTMSFDYVQFENNNNNDNDNEWSHAGAFYLNIELIPTFEDLISEKRPYEEEYQITGYAF